MLLLVIWGHMTSKNKILSHQNLWALHIAKSVMSDGSSALSSMNVDWWLPSQWGLMNFQLYNKSLVPQETVNFVSLNSKCFPWLRLRGDSWETKWTISLGTSHWVFIIIVFNFFISTFYQRNQLLSTLGLQMELFRGRCCCIRATCINYNLGQKYRENWTLPCLVSR